MQAMRRVAAQGSKKANLCLCCGAPMGRLRNGKTAKCPECGRLHDVDVLDTGTVIVTLRSCAKLFRKR